MRAQDWIRFAVLCAIWGSSFVFIRICAPALGPPLTAAGRVGMAGIVLVIYLRIIGFDTKWRQFRGYYFKLGLLASGLPFVCFAYGALYLPASLLSIINACTPLFGAVFGAIWLGEGFGWRRAIGVSMGVIGVALANRLGNVELTPATILAMGVTLIAPLSYALAGIYHKLRVSFLPAQGSAAWSQLSVAPLLLLFLPLAPPQQWPSPTVAGAWLTLSILCSAVAYLIFYRLLADIGPTKTTTITFVIPVFGMMWGALLLGERITGGMIVGSVIMIAGTWLVVTPARTDRDAD